MKILLTKRHWTKGYKHKQLKIKNCERLLSLAHSSIFIIQFLLLKVPAYMRLEIAF